jgi:DNA polymerase (family 10)
MDRPAVAQVLDQIASYLELQGENPFRIRAFRTAAKAVLSLPAEPAEALADGSLAATRGIGAATVAIVKELLDTGRSDVLERLREEVSPGLVEMMGIAGLGVARIRTIHDRLGINTLADLEGAARDGRLAALPGFGVRTADNVLKGIGFLRTAQGLRLSHHAAEEAESLRTALERVPGVVRAIVAGEVRRRSEVVRELVLVLVADVPASEVFFAIGQLPGLREIAGEDERRVTLRSAGGMAARIIVTPAVNLGAVLVQATGSEAHLGRLARYAATRGFTLDAAALWKGSTFVPTPDEASLYRALDLVPIPPELREGGNEIERAAAGPFPPLLERADLRGFLHCHTSWSDGNLTIEELALACRESGYTYVGLTDHSKSAGYAGGLSVDSLHLQWAEIDRVNASLKGIRVLKGVESDILADGQLDYDEATLAGFDFVIGSIHGRFAMTEAEMTARILRALDSPSLTILGHPTGRLLLSRKAYPLDLESVFAKAARNGVALEINADPHRLDLDWRTLARAREVGVMISIGADAHSRAGMEYMEYGVGIARKGGLGPRDVLNTRPVEEFLGFARARRGG